MIMMMIIIIIIPLLFFFKIIIFTSYYDNPLRVGGQRESVKERDEGLREERIR